jgi:glycogen synthase
LEVHVHRRGQAHLRGALRVARETAWRLETALASYRSFSRLGTRFDVIEAPDWAAEGLFFSLFRPVPLVVNVHSPLVFIYRGNNKSLGPDERMASVLERIAVGRADVVTAPSQFIVDELNRASWLPRNDVRVVTHPIDLELWKPRANHGPPRILSVGRLEPTKAPEILVDAASMLLGEIPSLEVVFIGRSNYRREGKPYREWVEGYARARSVPCRFLDPVPRVELAPWYASARTVVLASGYDNLPMSGLEAMAAGRPLVCSRRTGIAELVESGRAGATFEPGDPHALAQALQPLLASPVLADETGRRARELVERRCAPSAVTAERERCYREAIRRFRGRA